jgi:hypothetical protein
VEYRSVVVSEQCMFMRGSCHKFPVTDSCSLENQGRGGSRDIHCLSDDIAEWNSPHTDYPVEEVPERFVPLNDWQGLGNLGSLCLTIKAFHWVSKFLITLSPLEVGGGVVPTSRIIVLDKILGTLNYVPCVEAYPHIMVLYDNITQEQNQPPVDMITCFWAQKGASVGVKVTR